MTQETAPIYILGCDIDNTLVPTKENPAAEREVGYVALEVLTEVVKHEPAIVGYGSVTGRTIESHRAYEAEISSLGKAVDAMDFTITGVGTAVHSRLMGTFVQDRCWPPANPSWQPGSIRAAMQARPEVQLQEQEAQGVYKISYDVQGVADEEYDAYVADLHAQLATHGLAAQVIFSGGQFLDFLPSGVDKGRAFSYVATTMARPNHYSRVRLVAAGDSMNDAQLLQTADHAIVPSNAQPRFKQWAHDNIRHKTHFATEPFATGIMQGLSHFGVIK